MGIFLLQNSGCVNSGSVIECEEVTNEVAKNHKHQNWVSLTKKRRGSSEAYLGP